MVRNKLRAHLSMESMMGSRDNHESMAVTRSLSDIIANS